MRRRSRPDLQFGVFLAGFCRLRAGNQIGANENARECGLRIPLMSSRKDETALWYQTFKKNVRDFNVIFTCDTNKQTISISTASRARTFTVGPVFRVGPPGGGRRRRRRRRSTPRSGGWRRGSGSVTPSESSATTRIARRRLVAPYCVLDSRCALLRAVQSSRRGRPAQWARARARVPFSCVCV